jgi:hypothetical protein
VPGVEVWRQTFIESTMVDHRDRMACMRQLLGDKINKPDGKPGTLSLYYK